MARRRRKRPHQITRRRRRKDSGGLGRGLLCFFTFPLIILYYLCKLFGMAIVEIVELISSGSGRKRRKKKQYDVMDGREFEEFCADLLRRNGFSNIMTTRGSGDYGVDILAVHGNVSYAIQCKCYGSSVGNKAVQEIYSGKDFYKRQVGVVLTNQYFTPAALLTAQRNGILLWDRSQLIKFIKAARGHRCVAATAWRAE